MTRQATVKNVLNTLNEYGWDQRCLVDVDGALHPLKVQAQRGENAERAKAYYTSEADGITDRDVVLVAGKAIEREASG